MPALRVSIMSDGLAAQYVFRRLTVAPSSEHNLSEMDLRLEGGDIYSDRLSDTSASSGVW